MKLYIHPVSTASRPVMQFIADEKIPVEMVNVDILKGEHMGDDYGKRNPNRMIPLLEDGDFTLTESAAILRYLAEKTGSAAYPKDLKQRAKVNEAMDWLNSNFYKDWGYGLVYPQLFPHHKRDSDVGHASAIAWGKERSKAWLQLLNDHLIGEKQYLVGNEVTIADYFGAALVTVGELVHCDLSAYPNIQRWLGNMKKRPSYDPVYEVFNGFCASTKGQPWQAI
jgi:glutathione S-transferase